MGTITKAVTVSGITINYPSGPLPTAERVADLSAAFDRVKNPSHWKGAIDAIVNVRSDADLATILEAIEFYTATTGTAASLTSGRWHIKAPGYWAGPAN